ncbi:hypothetical protein [Azospirillum argentinense]
MSIFAVIATKGNKTIGAVLERQAAGRFYALKDDVWLVTYDGTTQKLAEDLGIRDGRNGSGLVIPVPNYSGRGAPELWEWIRANWSGD